LSRDELLVYFQKIDTDKSGYLEFTEFETFAVPIIIENLDNELGKRKMMRKTFRHTQALFNS